MSFMVKSPALPSLSASQQQQAASYKEAEPVPFGYGDGMHGAHWLSDAFHWRTAPAGKNQPDWQYASIAFGLAAGPITRVGKLKQDGKVIWDFGYTFAPGEDYRDFTLNASLSGGYAYRVRIYRGSETQTPDPTLVAGTGQDHPAYRGLAYAVATNIDLGVGNTTIPSFAIEVDSDAPALGANNNVGSAYGVNPILAIYGLLREARGGDFSSALLDAAHWAAQADALWTNGVNQRSGELTFCHPRFFQATNLADAVSQILAYFDGYLYAAGGQLRIAWFPGGTPAGTLPAIGEADLEQKPSGGGFPDWNQGATSVAVVFTDAAGRNFDDGSAIHHAPANRETGLAAAPGRKDRPFVLRADQAQMFAVELSAGAVGDASVTLQVLKSRAVRLDGTPLIPGDVLTWIYGPHALALTCRVVARRIRAGAASDLLEVVRERGAFPQAYSSAVEARVPYVPMPPGDIADHRLWYLPPGFGGGRQITALVDRPAAQNIATRVHLSSNGAAPWEEILLLNSFAAKGTLDAGGLTDAAATVRIACTSLDMVRMQAQSTLAQRDDTLLLLIDDELLSVGTITVVSAGVFDLAVLRGRQGSLAAAHAGAAATWLCYYDDLQPTTHEEFYGVLDGYGIYNSAIATKRFKFQAVSADSTNDPAPNDPGLAFTLPDLSSSDSAGTRTFHGPSAPAAGLRVGDLWFKTVAGVVVATYRWDGSAWIDVSDSRLAVDDGISPNAVSGGVLTGGLGMIVAEWTNPTNTPLQRVLIYIATTGSRPSNPSAVAASPQAFYFLDGLPASATRFFWFEAQATNGRKSTIAGPFSGTTRAGIDLSDIVPGMEMVGVGNALPNPVAYTGPKNFFLTTDQKLYRYTGVAWTVAVPAVDVTGQLTNAQIADLAAAKITGQIVDTQITPGAISTPKLAAGSVTTAKLAAGAVTANEIAAGEVTTSKLAAGAVTANEIAANAVIAGKIQAGAVTAAAVGANEIIANTANIANGVITSAKIVSLLANKIVANDLSAISAYLGAVEIGASGHLRGGATSFAAGTGFWLGLDDGAYKFRVGVPGGARIEWDGSSWTVVGLPGGAQAPGVPIPGNLGSPSMRFSAPAGAPAGWYMSYRVGNSALNVATSFPFDLNAGSATTMVWATGNAPGQTESDIFNESWNSLFL